MDLGHRRVGLLNLHPVTEEAPEATPPDAPWNPPAAERDRGWRSALSAAGIEPLEELAAFRPVEAAYDAARRLLDRPAAERPTALLCFSDGYAAQAMRAAESLGLKVPEDVSVVGFDDSSIATAVQPALTTVSQPVTEKGRLAVAALLDVMRGDASGGSPADPVRTVLPTSLVVRGSTAPPRA